MRNGLPGSIVIMAAGVAIVSVASLSIPVQGGQQPPAQQGGAGRGGPGRGGAPAPPAGPAKRLPGGKPDMTGYWAGGPGGLANIRAAITEVGGQPAPQDPASRIPYQPWAAAKAQQNSVNLYEEPELHCFLSGVPSQTYRQFGFQIVQTPDYMLAVNEFMGAVRHIPTDGRPHIPDSIKLFNGDSVGHWEGDTLVVETTNNNDRTWLDNFGNVHSDALVVIERWTPVDANNIQYEATLTDPKAYTAPFKIAGTYRRAQINDPAYEQMEFACVEGNQDIQHYTDVVGGTAKPGPSAAPPGSEAPVPAGGRGGRGGGPPRGGAPPGPPQ
ncbi:MAG: hypothetical protein DMG13_16430 [Acidobacteria bacterium]|nr:MAG: hypothetical protein DMG13_16430 [Acidobacteriota bacterium]